MKRNVPLLAFSLLIAGCFNPEETGPIAGTDAPTSGQADATSEDPDSTTDDPSDPDGTDNADDTKDGDESTDTNPDEGCTLEDECIDNADCNDGETCLETCVCSGSDESESDSDTNGPPSGSAYGPCDQCAADEVPAQLPGHEGCFCAPGCDGPESSCPEPEESTAQAACVLSDDGRNPTWCALLCSVDQNNCPSGATCEFIQEDGGMQIGVCTHPAR